MDYLGLFVGLGNPGAQYMGTRHNQGFALVDFLLTDAERHGRVESLSGGKFRCELWRCTLGRCTLGRCTLGHNAGWWLAAKPQTYMNLSGQCVQPLLAWHKLPINKLIVLHDELDLPAGQIRFKTGGGNAGHNGLKSITQNLGSPDFHRLRLGIGRPKNTEDSKHEAVSDFVLSRPHSDEKNILEASFAKALQTLEIFHKEGAKAASTYALRP